MFFFLKPLYNDDIKLKKDSFNLFPMTTAEIRRAPMNSNTPAFINDSVQIDPQGRVSIKDKKSSRKKPSINLLTMRFLERPKNRPWPAG